MIAAPLLPRFSPQCRRDAACAMAGCLCFGVAGFLQATFCPVCGNVLPSMNPAMLRYASASIGATLGCMVGPCFDRYNQRMNPWG